MNWAYVAGFTDGDGCITLETAKGKYHYSRIRWSQKESVSEVLDEIGAFLDDEGLKISTRNYSVAREGHKYPQRELCITNGEDTRYALHEMLPYLIVKRERAVDALAILDEVYELKRVHGNKYRRHMVAAG